jgi:hypothetical protein
MTNPTRDGSAVKQKSASDEPSVTWEDPLNHDRDNWAWFCKKIEQSLGHLMVSAGFRGTLLGMVTRAFGGDVGEGEDARCWASRESIGIVGGCSESSVRNWRSKFTRRQALRVSPRAGGGLIIFPAIARWVPWDERVSTHRPPEYVIDFKALEAFCIQLDALAAQFRSLKRGARAKRLADNEKVRKEKCAMRGLTEGIRALHGRGPRQLKAARAVDAFAKSFSALADGAVAASIKPAAARREEPIEKALHDEWVRRTSDGDWSPITDAHRERYHALIAAGSDPADAAILALGVAAELEPALREEPTKELATENDRTDGEMANENDEPSDSEEADFIADLVQAGMTPREAAQALLTARNRHGQPPAPKTHNAARVSAVVQMNALTVGSRPMQN